MQYGISEKRKANYSGYIPTGMGQIANTVSNNNLGMPVPSGGKFSRKSQDGSWYGYHDINRGVSASTPVYAVCDGTVTYKQAYTVYSGVKKLTSYGNFIEFTSSNRVYTAKYCHLSRFVGSKSDNQFFSDCSKKWLVGSLYDRNEIGEERSDNWIYRNNRKFIRVTFTF